MPRDLAAQRRGDPSRYNIAALERTVDLLHTMARLGPSSATVLAAASGCTIGNAFRILNTLEARGLAAQDGRRGTWRLGAAWMAVGWAAERDGGWAEAGHAVMGTLAQACAETVVLAVRDGEQARVIAVQVGTPGTPKAASPGERWPLYTGPGRLLLAHAPEEVVRAVLHGRFTRFGSGTLSEGVSVTEDLARIRAREWLITIGELGQGNVTASVGVCDAVGNVIAALSVVAARSRKSPLEALLTPLQAAAEEIGRALSGTIAAVAR